MLTTVILCGGRGVRLRPLSDSVPKPLAPLNGKPCLQHIIESYVRKGFGRFVLCVGYHGGAVIDFCRRQGFDARIEFSDAGEQAGILARLHEARALAGERMFVAYGDTLIDVDLARMLARHVECGAGATITVADVRSPFGLVATDGEGRIRSFEEKPVQSYFVGHFLVERSVLDEAAPDLVRMPDGDGLVALFQKLAALGRLRAFPYAGPTITFNTEKELDRAERDLVKFFTHREREDE